MADTSFEGETSLGITHVAPVQLRNTSCAQDGSTTVWMLGKE